jgi:hypothetical protein
LRKEPAEFATRWKPTVRNQLVEVWERAKGMSAALYSVITFRILIFLLSAWPDAKDGLQAMKNIKTMATLSNLSLRTQTQMVMR